MIITTGYLGVIFIPRSNKKSRSRNGFITASLLLPKEMFNFILYPFCFSCYALFVLKDLVQLKFLYSKQRKLLLTFYAHHLIFFLGTIAASIYDNAESYNFMMPCLLSTDYIRKTYIQIRIGGIEMLSDFYL